MLVLIGFILVLMIVAMIGVGRSENNEPVATATARPPTATPRPTVTPTPTPHTGWECINMANGNVTGQFPLELGLPCDSKLGCPGQRCYETIRGDIVPGTAVETPLWWPIVPFGGGALGIVLLVGLVFALVLRKPLTQLTTSLVQLAKSARAMVGAFKVPEQAKGTAGMDPQLWGEVARRSPDTMEELRRIFRQIAAPDEAEEVT